MAGGKKKAAKPKKEKEKKKKAKGKKGEPEAAVEAEAAAKIADEDVVSEDLDIDTGTGFEEVRAYVNLGARTTDLAICKAGGAQNVGFPRSIPIGGNQITAAILKATGVETFAEAEKIKLERTAVLSGMFDLEADQSRFDSNACTAATQVCDRVIAELRRTLDYFISQPEGVAVDSIVLSGGGCNLPYLAGYVEERLGLPVEVAHGLDNDRIKTPTQYSEDFDFSPYKVAIGLAAQGLAISPIKIDFLPPDIRTMRDFSSQFGEIAGLAGVIGVMVFLSSQIGGTTMKSLETQMQDLDAKISQRKPPYDQLMAAQGARKSVQEKIDVLAASFLPRDFWLRFLARIQDLKPPEVLITQIQCQPNYDNALRTDVVIVGEAEGRGAAIEFNSNLQAEKTHVSSTRLTDLQPMQTSRFGKPAFRFRIAAVVQDKEGYVVTRLMPEQTPAPAAGAPGAPGEFTGEITPEMLQMLMGGM